MARLLTAALVVLLACVSAFSQANLGRIKGSITDQAGGAMSSVTATDTQRGVTRTLTTDEAGAYNAPNLTPHCPRIFLLKGNTMFCRMASCFRVWALPSRTRTGPSGRVIDQTHLELVVVG